MSDPFYPYDPADERDASEKFIDDLRAHGADESDDAVDPMWIVKFQHVYDHHLHTAPERLQFCSQVLARALFRGDLSHAVFAHVVALRDDELQNAQNVDFVTECNNQFLLYGHDDTPGYHDAVEQNFYLYPDIADPLRRMQTMSLLLRDQVLYKKINGAHDFPTDDWTALEQFWSDDLLDAHNPVSLEDKVSQCHVMLESHMGTDSLLENAIEPFLFQHLSSFSRLWRDDETGKRPEGRRLYCRNTVLNLALHLPHDHERLGFWTGVAAQILALQAPDDSDDGRATLFGKITPHMRHFAGNRRVMPLIGAVEASTDYIDRERVLAFYEHSMKTEQGDNWPETAGSFVHDMVAYPHVMADIGFRATLNMMADNAMTRFRRPRQGSDIYYTLVMREFCSLYEHDEPNLLARIEAFRDVELKTVPGSFLNGFAHNRADILEHLVFPAAGSVPDHADPSASIRVQRFVMPHGLDIN